MKTCTKCGGTKPTEEFSKGVFVMNAKNFGHFNELRRETERQLAEDANRADAIVGGICLVLFLGYVVASYLGVIA